MFDDGRVVFNGRKDTSKVGVWNKKVEPEVYAELLTMIVKTRVLEKEIKRKTCLKGRSMLIVMRSASDAGDVRTVSLNSGCEGHADLVKRIEGGVHRFHGCREVARAAMTGTLITILLWFCAPVGPFLRTGRRRAAARSNTARYLNTSVRVQRLGDLRDRLERRAAGLGRALHRREARRFVHPERITLVRGGV